jgi:transposase
LLAVMQQPNQQIAFLEALRGQVTEHHRSMWGLHLGQIDALDKAIAQVDAQVGRSLSPCESAPTC